MTEADALDAMGHAYRSLARIAPIYSVLRARMHIAAGRCRALADQARTNSRPAPTASPKGK